MKKILSCVALTTALVFTVTACQDGFSKNDLNKHIAGAEKKRQIEINRELTIINMIERSDTSQIYGENIPEEFRNITLPDTRYSELSYSPYSARSLTYVDFVKELHIACDGTISYKNPFGIESKISLNIFISNGRWSTEYLSICGKLEIPEGEKVVILATKSAQLKDIQFLTNRNSLLGLILKNASYEGTSPQLTVSPESILTLKFE